MLRTSEQGRSTDRENFPPCGESPPTPVSPSPGDSPRSARSDASAQGVAGQPVAASAAAAAAPPSHRAAAAGDSPQAEGPARRPLAQDEIVRFLALAECGCSLREAAAEIGRNHTTLLKRMKTDRELGRAFRAAREKARSNPLAQIREACKTSWRAAAWLVNYYDARERGRHVAKMTRKDNRSPSAASQSVAAGKPGKPADTGEVSDGAPAT